jgi:hypothetical protein
MVDDEEKFWLPGLPIEARILNMEMPSMFSETNFSLCKFHARPTAQVPM